MNPKKMANEELVMHLDLWLALGGGPVTTEAQKDFFEEVIMRLLMTNRINS